MPTYTYRREDGTTFDIRQKFTDDPLEVDPKTGQTVTRVIQTAGVIFKGSGFYVTDNRSANNPAAPKSGENGKSEPAKSSENSSGSSSKSTNTNSDSASSPAAD